MGPINFWDKLLGDLSPPKTAHAHRTACDRTPQPNDGCPTNGHTQFQYEGRQQCILQPEAQVGAA